MNKTNSQEHQRRITYNLHQFPPGLEEAEKNRDQNIKATGRKLKPAMQKQRNQQLQPK
jgi:hypothetical protein